MLEQLVQIQILHKTVLQPTPLQLQMLWEHLELVALMWLVLELLVEVVAQLRR